MPKLKTDDPDGALELYELLGMAAYPYCFGLTMNLKYSVFQL